MIKLFLNKTDDFLSNSIKDIFNSTENKYKFKNLSIDISQELKNFEDNPLTCLIGCDTKFESNIKLQVKKMLAIFFVIIPILGFLVLAYILNIEYSYAFILTFIVAMLATSRLDVIASRYVTTRLTTPLKSQS